MAGPHASVLRAITHDQVGLALWWRAPCPALASVLRGLLAGPSFCLVAAGEPGAAKDALLRALPRAARPLGLDVGRLATLFAELRGVSVVRLRLEHVRDCSCPRLHVDDVGLRLLCTYAGRGTEWQDSLGTIRRMPTGHVGVFKGRRWPFEGPRVLHRSPVQADLPLSGRGRMLLAIDEMALN